MFESSQYDGRKRCSFRVNAARIDERSPTILDGSFSLIEEYRGDLVSDVLVIAERARSAALQMAKASAEARNQAILAIAEAIDREKTQIMKENSGDIQEASKTRLAAPLLKRLRLDESKIEDLTRGLRVLVQLEDPVGKTLFSSEMDHRLELYKVSCPIGVVGAIFESRPDVLVQIAALCLKSGNSVVLKGGAEAKRTNRFLAGILRKTIGQFSEIPKDSVQLIETRRDVAALLKLDDYVDLLLPRGSSSLVTYVKETSRIPVLGHAEGICHEYIDLHANLDMAVRICYDAKVQYPAVCNGMNTLLVHKKVADTFLPMMSKEYQVAGVELRGDKGTRKILSQVKKAKEMDWSTEYLDLVLNIRLVNSLQEAIDHVNRYGSHHTDGIITENTENARKFLNEVDSAVVIHNASTRFSDGYRFGFGAEVGISTGKIHARGPVGLDGLVTHKYVIAGSGQVVSSYIGDRAKHFTHRRLSKRWNP